MLEVWYHFEKQTQPDAYNESENKMENLNNFKQYMMEVTYFAEQVIESGDQFDDNQTNNRIWTNLQDCELLQENNIGLVLEFSPNKNVWEKYEDKLLSEFDQAYYALHEDIFEKVLELR